MYESAADPLQPKPEFYRELLTAADALTYGEPDGIANMANVAALLGQLMLELNWAGFYRLIDDELVLGPFWGKPACIRIAVGQGVCGSAAARAASVRVEDVQAFAGHIACDAASRSELVVPVWRHGVLHAVIDLDSPVPSRFDAEDQAGIEALSELLGERL